MWVLKKRRDTTGIYVYGSLTGNNNNQEHIKRIASTKSPSNYLVNCTQAAKSEDKTMEMPR